MNQILLISASLVTCFFLSSCTRTAAIRDVSSHSLPVQSKGLTNQEVSERIQMAAGKRGWNCKKASENKLICTVSRRVHTATVAVNHTQSDFSISYVDSTNLMSKGGKIHPKYNKWVKLLEKDIERALRR